MERLIDADVLYRKTAEWEDDRFNWARWSTILGERSAFKHDIADAPTVDAEPVRHGRWIIDDGCSYCSVCRNNFKKAIMNHAKYCPMCGAKMDGERRKNNV